MSSFDEQRSEVQICLARTIQTFLRNAFEKYKIRESQRQSQFGRVQEVEAANTLGKQLVNCTQNKWNFTPAVKKQISDVAQSLSVLSRTLNENRLNSKNHTNQRRRAQSSQDNFNLSEDKPYF